MNQSLVFELPLPPQRGNEHAGWKGRYFKRKAYWIACDNTVTLRKNPRAPHLPWPHASAEIEMRTFNAMDKDNANARLKDLLDWLESRGYIVNDRDLTYTLNPTVSRKNPGITLTLVEVPDAATKG